MVSIFSACLMAAGVALLVLLAVLLGGWLVFKSKAAPGETMFRAPKGEVFRIADASDVDNPDEGPTADEKKVFERTEKFLSMFGGK